MSGRGKVTKSEIVLLGLTAAFLCGLAALSAGDRAERTPGAVIETQIQVPEEEIAPEFPPVDLNTATAEELDELPGIGMTLARRIIAYREANGPFETLEELMEVSGIGPAKFAELEGQITLGQETETDETDGGDAAHEDPGG